MQPVVVRPSVAPQLADPVVLAVIATGQERLRAALRSVAATPELLGRLTRIVVLDGGRTPSATVLREAVRLPAGMLRVVRQPDVAPAAAVARAVAEAVAEPGAGAVLVLDDRALTDPAALLRALARREPGTEVVGLRSPAAREPGPAAWWGAVLPLDGVRALGSALPEAGSGALADLVLRAAEAGFRTAEVEAPGPVPRLDEVDLLRLALLHAPLTARTLLLRGVAADGRLLATLRIRELAARRRSLRALGSGSRLLLWLAWPALRRTARAGALDRASVEEWSLRFPAAPVNPGWPHAEQQESEKRPPAVRLPAWPTTKRGRSAA